VGRRSGSPPKYKVLLAEDEKINRTLMSFIFKQQNWGLTAVANGREALDALDNGDFDLVLMDIQMPLMGGCEAAALIRKKEAETGGHIPVIALTGNAIADFGEESHMRCFDDCIAKPFSLEAFVQVVERHLSPGR